MGAAGHVDVYDLQKLDDEHRRRHGRALADDWTYLQADATGQHRALVVELDGRKWVLRYWDDQGWHDSAEAFWCAFTEGESWDESAAHRRLLETILRRDLRLLERRAALQKVARAIKRHMPDGWGFVVCLASYARKDGEQGSYMTWLSSIEREDAIALLRELARKVEREEPTV